MSLPFPHQRYHSCKIQQLLGPVIGEAYDWQVYRVETASGVIATAVKG